MPQDHVADLDFEPNYEQAVAAACEWQKAQEAALGHHVSLELATRRAVFIQKKAYARAHKGYVIAQARRHRVNPCSGRPAARRGGRSSSSRGDPDLADPDRPRAVVALTAARARRAS